MNLFFARVKNPVALSAIVPGSWRSKVDAQYSEKEHSHGKRMHVVVARRHDFEPGDRFGRIGAS
jgi:hypothetical protein